MKKELNNNYSFNRLTKTSESECYEDGEICFSDLIIHLLKQYIKKNYKTDFINESIIDKFSPNDIINFFKKKLNCDSESCILKNPEIKKKLTSDPHIIDYELKTRFKTEGPRNSIELLNNINIDNTLILWAREKKDFFPCPFAMIDFETNGEFLGRVNLASLLYDKAVWYLDPIYGLVYGPFCTFGCVINTDVSTGIGKHWVSIFVDLREDPWTFEFFNSSGNDPPPEIVKFFKKQKQNLEEMPEEKRKNVKIVECSNKQHQIDNHSCGVYALFFIKARLEGTLYEYFCNHYITSSDITKFRKHLFRYH